MALKNNLFTISPHPLFISTFMLMGGIWLQSLVCNPIPLSLILCSSSILILFILLKKISWHSTANYSLYIGIFACGIFLYQNQLTYYDTFYERINNKSCYDLIGTVTDLQYLDQQHKHLIILNKNQLYQNNEFTVATNWSIYLYATIYENIQVGDTLLITNTKFKKQNNNSFKHYLLKENAIATTFLSQKSVIKQVNRPLFSLNRWIFNKKMELFKNLKSKMSCKTFSFFSSLFLGKKQHNYHQENLKEQFKWWGLSHYLARSGLHLIVFIFLWKFFFRCFPLSYILKTSVLIIISLVYFLLSWSSISFVRAFFSFFIYCLFLLFDQQINGLHILTLLTLLILILNPMQLFFLDFQLSFSLTFALLWFNFLHYKFSKKTVK